MVIDDNIIYLSRVGRLRIAKRIKAKPTQTLKQQQRHLQLQLRRRLLILEASDLTATYDESKASKISLQGTTATASGEGVTVNGSTVEITKAGTYIVEGTASKVQLKVAAGKGR